MTQQQATRIVNRRITIDVQTYMRDIDNLTQVKRPTGEQIIQASGYYFSAIEAVLIARELRLMSEDQFKKNMNILDDLMRKTHKYFKIN